jgi:uncharacterized protein YkwD
VKNYQESYQNFRQRGEFRSRSSKAAKESSESSSDEEEAKEEFSKEALEAHNVCRKKHGAKPLKYSKKVGLTKTIESASNFTIPSSLQLSAFAQEWADKLAREDGFEHRQNNPHGENLYSSWSSNPKAKVISPKGKKRAGFLFSQN